MIARLTPHRLRAPLAGALVGWVILLAFGQREWFNGWCLVGLLAGQWLLWAWLWWQASKPNGLSSRELWLWFALLRLPGLLSAPVLEDDHFRFLWDGRQFALTGNPYASAPIDHFHDPRVPERFQRVLDQINYPDVPTIYGPLCQVAFLLSCLVAPGSLWPWKLMLFGAELLGFSWLSRLAGPRSALLFGLCPLVIFETSFNAHPDALGVCLLTGAVGLAQRGNATASGIVLGLASAAKVFALVAAPFVLLRANWRAWAAFGATIATCYAPFWLQGSAADFAGLATYAGRWEFNSSVFGLSQALLGAKAARGLSAVLLAAALGGLWLWHRRRRDVVVPRGDWIFAAFFALSATVNPWYLLWLVPFVAIRPSAWGIAALAAVSLSYLYEANLGNAGGGFTHPGWVRPLEYGVIALAALGTWRRARGGASAIEKSA